MVHYITSLVAPPHSHGGESITAMADVTVTNYLTCHYPSGYFSDRKLFAAAAVAILMSRSGGWPIGEEGVWLASRERMCSDSGNCVLVSS